MPFIANQTVKIHYQVLGQGAPVVLQHGLFGSLEDWHDYGYVAALQEAYTVILIDARGHGESDKPHEPGLYTPQIMASDVVVVLDALGIDRSHFIGFSMGGRSGYALAQHWPDRLRSLVVLDDTPDAAPDITQRLKACRAIKIWGAELPKATAKHRARLVSNDVAALTAAAHSLGHAAAESLEHFDSPCLILATGRPEERNRTKRGAEQIKHAEFIRLEDFEHIDILFRGGEVLPYVLDFLAKLN